MCVYIYIYIYCSAELAERVERGNFKSRTCVWKPKRVRLSPSSSLCLRLSVCLPKLYIALCLFIVLFLILFLTQLLLSFERQPTSRPRPGGAAAAEEYLIVYIRYD